MDHYKQHFTYPSSNNEDVIHVTVWQPMKPRAIVQICHGMCEYVERYDEFAQFLNQYDILVVGNDHLGHGASARDEEHLGYFAEENGDLFLVEDEHMLYLIMRQYYPDLPYFLFGHSMGSFITRKYINEYGHELNGYICSGTAGLQKGKFKLRLVNFLIKRFGPLHRSKMMDKLVFTPYRLPFKQILFKESKKDKSPYLWLSRDRQVVEAYENDPKCAFSFPLAGYRDLFQLLIDVSEPEWIQNVPPNLPIYFICGNEDPVSKNGKGPAQLKQLLDYGGSKDIQLKIYPNARHELVNEICKFNVFSDVLNWIDEHMESQESSVVEQSDSETNVSPNQERPSEAE